MPLTPSDIRYIDFEPTTQDIYANRFEVKVTEDTMLHEFHVVGIPNGRSKRMKKMFMDTAIEKSDVLRSNQHHFATDGMKIIVAWEDLREKFKSKGESIKINGTETYHLVKVLDSKDDSVSLYLQHIRVVDTRGLQNFGSSKQPQPGFDPMTWNENTTLNALNIVIAKCFGGGIVRVGSNKLFMETGSNCRP